MRAPIAFLFLGETLLIPHLYPIVEALAARSDRTIDLWVSTSMHENLLAGWTGKIADRVRIRRAPGFRTVADDRHGRNPRLPAKLPMLLRLAPTLRRAHAVISAEQTSLWLPRLFPMRAPFINTLHGAGAMYAREDPRRRAASLTLVASERERRLFLDLGIDPHKIAVTGYVKAGFTHHRRGRALFADDRPIVLYAPHWQKHRSSWWEMGHGVVRDIVADGRYNLIFAPHQRLVERAPEVRTVAESLRGIPHVRCDIDSFAMVDGTYTAAADIYLGDTSSQANEFMMRPRPCVFLNPRAVDWRDDASYATWDGGEVVCAAEDVIAALERAPARHGEFVEFQRYFATDTLGDVSGAGPVRAAEAIMSFLRDDDPSSEALAFQSGSAKGGA